MTLEKYNSCNVELIVDKEDKRQFFVNNQNVGYYFAIRYPAGLSLDQSVSNLLEEKRCYPEDIIFELGYITIFEQYRENHYGSYLLGLSLIEAASNLKNDYFKAISFNSKIINSLGKLNIYPSYVGESCCDFLINLKECRDLTRNVESYLENYNFS